MISLLDGEVTGALRQWRSRNAMTTILGSADLSKMAREVRERAVFSARCTNADFLQRLSEVVDELLSGKTNMASARWELMKSLKQLGYDPEVGFPDEMGEVPPAERGSLQDLSSERRLNLMLETNRRMAAGFGMMTGGNTPLALHHFPAWELVRLYPRIIPRGSEESESPGWYERWAEAGAAVNFEGALDGPLMALKGSPIWQALGDGAGGHNDCLNNPYPPFAFNSGMGWKAVPRARAIQEGLLHETSQVPRALGATLSPGRQEIVAVFDRLSPALRDVIRKALP